MTAKPRPDAASEPIAAGAPINAKDQEAADAAERAARERRAESAAWWRQQERARLADKLALPAARGLLEQLTQLPGLIDRLDDTDRNRVARLEAGVAAGRVSSLGLLMVQHAVAPHLPVVDAPT